MKCFTPSASHTGRRALQRVGDATEVHHDSLDAVAFALNLGLEPLHLVAVERVLDILCSSLAKLMPS